VKSIRVLWDAQDAFFSPRLKNSNGCTLACDTAAGALEVIFESKPAGGRSADFA
jgi:hypothetical protein